MKGIVNDERDSSKNEYGGGIIETLRLNFYE